MGRHIGLVGPKHSGKTTAGAYLVTSHGFVKMALADPLKNLAVDMMNVFHKNQKLPPINREFLDRNKDIVFVPFLQWLGTDYGRVFLKSPTRWIEQFLDNAYGSEKPVVCDDIRFVNEAEELRKHGFLIVRLMRPETDRQTSLTRSQVNPDTANHASETELEQIRADIHIHAATLDEQRIALDLCLEFQRMCRELTEMSAYVPKRAEPGYNADFAQAAKEFFTRVYKASTVSFESPPYQAMWEKIVEHANA